MVRGDSGKRVYADEGQPEDDVWTFYKSDELRSLNSMSNERRSIKYPTQKPEKLIAKLILASSKPGDKVFDPFLGSGTTAVVASKLGRKYCGIEMNHEYCLLAAKRLDKAVDDKTIQGYTDGVFWERNSI